MSGILIPAKICLVYVKKEIWTSEYTQLTYQRWRFEREDGLQAANTLPHIVQQPDKIFILLHFLSPVIIVVDSDPSINNKKSKNPFLLFYDFFLNFYLRRLM